MNVADLFARLGHWAATRPTHTKFFFCFAVTVLLVELSFRRFGPRSKAYARWTHAFEAIGNVWAAVILSLIYVLSVGPVGLFMRLSGKDPLDRALGHAGSAWKSHEPNPLGPRAAARHQF